MNFNNTHTMDNSIDENMMFFSFKKGADAARHTHNGYIEMKLEKAINRGFKMMIVESSSSFFWKKRRKNPFKKESMMCVIHWKKKGDIDKESTECYFFWRKSTMNIQRKKKEKRIRM